MSTLKLNSQQTWLKSSLKAFCSSTSLHGYNYIVRENANKFERTCWGLIVFCASITSIVLLGISWMLYAETPTVTVIDSTHYSVSNIPFPAITICNINKISRIAAYRLSERLSRPDNVTIDKLASLFRLILHFEGIGDASSEDYTTLDNILKTNEYDVRRTLTLLAPNCVDMLKRCIWKGTQTRCDTLFQPINTSVGICCSFNYYGLAKNNFPIKMAHSIPKLPRRVTACGYQTGLSVLIKPAINDYFATLFSSNGFQVFIHNAYDYPDDNAVIKVIPSKLEVFVSVTPESLHSISAVRRLSFQQRNCLFETEQKLSTMHRYSYINCMAECRAHIIQRKCHCIPYHMPNNGSTATCQMNDIFCVKAHKEIMYSAIPGLNLSLKYLVQAKLSESDCSHCLPDCQLLQYPSEITSGTINRHYSFNALSFFKNIELTDETLMHVFFNDLVSTHYRKDIYQNWLAILASFGGILGLLLGFSFVTGFELFYFLTIRSLFNKYVLKKVKF